MKATDREKKMLSVLFQGMSKAELIDAIAASAKLTKADAGRILEEMPSKIDVARMLACMSKKQFSELLLGNDRLVIIDAISAGAKLTKADAGRALDATIESIHKALKRKLKVVFGGKGQ